MISEIIIINKKINQYINNNEFSELHRYTCFDFKYVEYKKILANCSDKLVLEHIIKNAIIVIIFSIVT